VPASFLFQPQLLVYGSFITNQWMIKYLSATHVARWFQYKTKDATFSHEYIDKTSKIYHMGQTLSNSIF